MKVRQYLLRIASPLLFLVAPSAIYAQPPRFDGLVGVFDNAIDISFPIAVAVAVGFIIYAGLMWIISAGDPQKIKRAQGTMTWAVIGLVFIAIFRFLLIILFDFLTT